MTRWMLPAMAGFSLLVGCQPAATETSAASAEAASPACMLTVGWDPWEPYSYETLEGRITGLDVDLVRQMGEAADCEVRFHKGNWVALLDELRAGEIDVLMAATPTADRRDFAHFSEPYRDESFALFAQQAKAQMYQGTSLEALLTDGKRIGITDGYYYGDGVQALLSDPQFDAQIIAAPVPEANYRHLEEGLVDVVIGDPYVASAVLRRTGLGEAIEQLRGHVHAGTVTFMFSRESVSAEQVTAMNAALDRLESAGHIAGTLDRYRGS
ncbi:MAG: transporter substrate-binding domain-containing protein [Abyssibacter sp.]|uniref:substrate-binding periplasmic protein n=1 Tax=Abyssibacter sp. TaxID=2320200 RepID=UPI002EBB2D4B|nr:transporter substrate-binding domain-containing protein [Pseudomonadota bacterium]